MYLSAFNYFFRDLWQKTLQRRKRAFQAREYIDPQLYLESAENLYELCLPGLQSVHLGIAIIPAHKGKAYVSSSGTVKGKLSKDQAPTVEMHLWGIDNYGRYYDLGQSQEYLLALAASLLLEQSEHSKKNYWELLTHAQQRKAPKLSNELVLGKIPVEFSELISQIPAANYGELILKAYAFVEYKVYDIYQKCDALRHNNWNEMYLYITADDSFEVDFTESEEKRLLKGERMWKEIIAEQQSRMEILNKESQ